MLAFSSLVPLIYFYSYLPIKKKKKKGKEKVIPLKRGKTHFVKSTLGSLLILFIALFVIPKLVTMRLGKVQKDFLWGGTLKKKPHVVK